MKWTKGKPADKAPVGRDLLVAYDYDGKTRFRVCRARHGQDRVCVPCLQWVSMPGSQMADAPSRYWELPK